MTCEGWVRFGEPVYYCPGVGIWHKACERPKNLQTHWDEAQKRKALEL